MQPLYSQLKRDRSNTQICYKSLYLNFSASQENYSTIPYAKTEIDLCLVQDQTC